MHRTLLTGTQKQFRSPFKFLKNANEDNSASDFSEFNIIFARVSEVTLKLTKILIGKNIVFLLQVASII